MPSRKYFDSVIVALVIFAAACRSTPEDRQPGYLIAGIESYPLQLDPRFSTDANSVRIGNLIYSSLLRSDEHLQLRLDLASSWRRLNERNYEFTLRRGVRFHNGQPLTAADVKYTFESMLDPMSHSPKRGQLKHLASIEQSGSHELRFQLDAPHTPFIEQFTLGIVPAGSPANDKPPPGSGPFKLEAVDSGEKVILKANADYWDGKPTLAGVVFKAIPDAMVRALEFKKGLIDFMQNDIEPDMLPWLKKNAGADIGVHQGTSFQYIGINLTHPILRHRKVRQALAQAIDRDAIIKHLLKDTGTAASGLLSPINWAYDDSIRRWPYDPVNARKLLDEAGYPDPDGAGPLPRFRLSFKTTNVDLRRRLAEAIKEQLQQVGIELEIRSYEWGTFFSDVKKGNFHLYSLAWVGIMDPDIEYQLFHSASVPPNGDNRGRYSNPEIDRLLEQGRVASDESARKRIYSQAQRILADDLPYVPLWWWKNVIVKKPSIHGFVPYPDGDFFSLKNVSIR
ncbi:MAG TPA: ABC transporter substrate-binding protein [Candidatus Binatus sp.]|nr:ABC transporter substrate-binding protein [Candidatus Binatus sp.]